MSLRQFMAFFKDDIRDVYIPQARRQYLVRKKKISSIILLCSWAELWKMKLLKVL